MNYYIPVAKQVRVCRCGVSFHGSKVSKYCSRKCRNKTRIESISYNNYIRERLAKKRGGICICATCRQQFNTTHKRKYCSDVCNPHVRIWDNSTRTCVTCNAEYTPRTRYQRYCRRSCQPYGNGGRSRYYQTKEWKLLRATFVLAHTLVNGLPISNKYCIECYIKQGRLNDMYAVDHIVPRNQGGIDSHSNLQSLCRHHHQSKSATGRK